MWPRLGPAVVLLRAETVCDSVRQCASIVGGLTVFEDADEQRLVGVAVPPVGRHLGVERLRDPNVQLAAETETRVLNHRQRNQVESVCRSKGKIAAAT